MKALSLTQPWATLVISGEKVIETRGWRPRSVLGQDIAIHAARGFPLAARQLCEQSPFAESLKCSWIQLPVGAVLGIVTVMSFYPVEQLGGIGAKERAFGDYSPGRFGWYLHNWRPLKTPVAARGALGIWHLPERVEALVREQLEAQEGAR